jgi:hypothetical protein
MYIEYAPANAAPPAKYPNLAIAAMRAHPPSRTSCLPWTWCLYAPLENEGLRCRLGGSGAAAGLCLRPGSGGPSARDVRLV